jgi:hypothetical protein
MVKAESRPSNLGISNGGYMGEDTAMRIAWGVVLDGEAFDLEDWQEALKHPFDPWVMATEGELILRSSLLDPTTTSSGAYEIAKVLMEQVNGALGVSHGARVIRLGAIAEILSDGTRRRHVFAHRSEAARIRDRPTAQVFGADGKPKPQPPPAKSDPQRWLSIAAEDDLLADALTYFSRGDEWFDIYKALECLILRFCAGEKEFLDLGWADAGEIARLKRTANFERHARRKFVPPPSPMGRTEARDLLAKLMARALGEAGTTPRGAARPA